MVIPARYTSLDLQGLNDTKGGDLDLLIRTNDPTQLLTKKLTFKARVKQLIGDQKDGVIVRSTSAPDRQDHIYQEALKDNAMKDWQMRFNAARKESELHFHHLDHALQQTPAFIL